MLSRKEMIKIIQEGGSVTYAGQHFKTIAELPSEAELSLGDPEKEKQAEVTLKAELEALQAQLALLKEAKKEEIIEEKVSKKSDAGDRKVAAAETPAKNKAE